MHEHGILIQTITETFRSSIQQVATVRYLTGNGLWGAFVLLCSAEWVAPTDRRERLWGSWCRESTGHVLVSIYETIR